MNVAGGVCDDQRVRGGRYDAGVLREKALELGRQIVGIQILQWDYLGPQIVSRGKPTQLLSELDRKARLDRLCDRQHLVDSGRGSDHREAAHFQHRVQNLEGHLERHRLGRDHGYRAGDLVRLDDGDLGGVAQEPEQMIDVEAVELHGDGLCSARTRNHLELRGGRGRRGGWGLLGAGRLRARPGPAGAPGLGAVAHRDAQADHQCNRQCSPSESERWIHTIHPSRRAVGEPNGIPICHLRSLSSPFRTQKAESPLLQSTVSPRHGGDPGTTSTAAAAA